MSKAGEKLIRAAQEARAVAAGGIPAARITIDGHTYVPIAEIERLTAEIERLRAALKPFADYGAAIDANPASRPYGNMVGVTLDPTYLDAQVKLGDLRLAARVYQQKRKET